MRLEICKKCQHKWTEKDSYGVEYYCNVENHYRTQSSYFSFQRARPKIGKEFFLTTRKCEPSSFQVPVECPFLLEHTMNGAK